MSPRDHSGLGPLFAWGDALRHSRANRRRLRHRMLATGGIVTLVMLTIIRPPAPRLVWNESPSAPVGLYQVTPEQRPARGDMVIARVPTGYRVLAATRHYIPGNVPLVKRVAAGPGDHIYARDRAIFVNGRHIAERQKVDAQRRPLPWWSGCRALREGEYFLLMGNVPASFDGRYFGISRQSDIIGKAQLLWAR